MRNFKTMLKHFLLTVVATLNLAACSGGGSEETVEPPPPPPPPRTAERLIFTADDGNPVNGPVEIYSVEDNGNQFTLIAANDQSLGLGKVTLSPDHKSIAYIDNLGIYKNQLFVAPVEGGASTLIDKPVRSYHWSPDSQHLTYSSSKEFNPYYSDVDQVYIADVQNASNKRINGSVGNPVQVDVHSPRWTSHGQYVVQEVSTYINNGVALGFGLNIHEVGGAEFNSTRILNTDIIYRKELSTSGNYVAVDMRDSSGNALAIVSLAGQLKLLSRTTSHSDFLWSPIQDNLVYVDGPNNSLIKIYEVATQIEKELVNTTLLSGFSNSVREISWSPNGQKIAFVAKFEDDNCVCLYQVDPALGTSSIQKLSLNASFAKRIKWSPNSQSIAYVNTDQLNNDKKDLYSVRVSSGAITKLSNNFLGDESVPEFDWAPSSTGITYRVQHGSSSSTNSVSKGLYYVNIHTPTPEYINIGELDNISNLQYARF